MIAKTITYKGVDNEERTEDFYFNLSEAEVTEMELGTSGGMTDYITKIVAAKDTPSIIAIFKELILRSYGEKSPDGKRFIKSPELSKAFSETEAYSKLFMKLATDDKAAADFVNGIMPESMRNNTGSAPIPINQK